MAAIGLKTHIWNNNLRSLLLLGAYPFLIGLMVWAIAFAGSLAQAKGYTKVFCLWASSLDCLHQAAPNTAEALNRALQESGNLVMEWWPSVLTVVAVWFILSYFFQTYMVRAMCHAHPATRQEEPDLYNLLENLCISRGMKMPRLEIIETAALNAFASGIDERSYAITVTRGLLHTLQKDEIEAVLGHELTHILNRDVRLLIISVIFTGMVGVIAQIAWSVLRHALYGGGRRQGDIRIFLIMAVIAGILWIGYAATMFTRFALSRRREFMADAGSVELTKNPEAMMRALQRISGHDRIPGATDDIALMCIENSRLFFGLMATHPPIEERIAAISQMTRTPVPEWGAAEETETAGQAMPPGRKMPWS